MADMVSALDDHLVTGRFGGSEQPAVSLSEMPAFNLFQLAAWPETVSKVADIVIKTAGIAKAPGPGKASAGDKGTLLRVEPLKWWLIANGHAGMTPPVIPPEKGSFLDLSHSRTWLKMGGEKADVLLNHFLPIDLREDSFPTGSVASTAFHHIGVTLWHSDDGFNLLLPRSFAASLWQMLQESATQYGLEVT
ncbi:MAG: sarcosine oxidase subunit gamma [Geminicoccaceae bacterium]